MKKLIYYSLMVPALLLGLVGAILIVLFAVLQEWWINEESDN